jgi:hypothetical protein
MAWFYDGIILTLSVRLPRAKKKGGKPAAPASFTACPNNQAIEAQGDADRVHIVSRLPHALIWR